MFQSDRQTYRQTDRQTHRAQTMRIPDYSLYAQTTQIVAMLQLRVTIHLAEFQFRLQDEKTIISEIHIRRSLKRPSKNYNVNDSNGDDDNDYYEVIDDDDDDNDDNNNDNYYDDDEDEDVD
ncbi:hypothetical protein DPMN_161886 [Dreissena polymorpha]|uniref:Uncharacterized protein n=1 Tax=Dreissena polymorpha TaxID=45954 RepID=A0A9D4IQ23_DREPO|nr:hypothetical protein DPMN_161886 [Dreissena polymorpha]